MPGSQGNKGTRGEIEGSKGMQKKWQERDVGNEEEHCRNYGKADRRGIEEEKHGCGVKASYGIP